MSITQVLLSNEDISDAVNDFVFDEPMKHGEVKTIEVLGIKIDYQCYNKFDTEHYDMWCARYGFETTERAYDKCDILDTAKRVAMTHIMTAIRDGIAMHLEVTA
jgi:hypothetical protein